MTTKGTLRRARKEALLTSLPFQRINHRPRDPMNDTDRGTGPMEFSETPKGYLAREKWARRYDSLNGAPEGMEDY